ncbi:MAG: imidazoleglycerol-phosphate dehydratase HisB [Firmicutes bacterium]|nr:imidazoleglycerol-phosphate dehydratase HisB [Bacillota bacterium]
MSEARVSRVERKTKETLVQVGVNLDVTSPAVIDTGIGFFDHMLEQLAKHSLFGLSIQAQGDLEVDFHHTVEDVGITLGQALKEALRSKEGIERYGTFDVPMDDALARVVLDICGRPYLVLTAQFPQERVGDFETCLVKEFLQAFCTYAGITLHAQVTGQNSHHMIEALFKALGRALRMAAARNPKISGIPSTKGVLE